MARKEKRFHYLYKIVNIKNDKYYIGMHSTDNLDDGYMGGGKRITNSVRKHGKDSHTKEILEYFNDRESLRQREIELVNEDLLNDPMCMNLQPGGGGGLVNKNHMEKFTKAGAIAFSNKVKTDPNFRKELLEHISKILKKTHSEGKVRYDTFKDKHHTDDSKKLISEKNKIAQLGTKNSQFGTFWINKDTEIKKIKSHEFILYEGNGWKRGRK
jgi:hypothetical protein